MTDEVGEVTGGDVVVVFSSVSGIPTPTTVLGGMGEEASVLGGVMGEEASVSGAGGMLLTPLGAEEGWLAVMLTMHSFLPSSSDCS